VRVVPTGILSTPTTVLATMTSVAGAGVSLVGRYRLEGPVASGGAGQVWRAVDLVLERPVAVKLLRPEAAGDPEARGRFRAEARNTSRLSHPAVAQVYDYGEDGSPGVPFLVMELVTGPSLAEVLACGPLDPGQAMDVIAQVAAGLHAAHSAGLVHRDIKPANLLITADGQVKITDFGIASVTQAAPLTATGILIGTPAYLAPERAAGASAIPASDLYSLGVVGYECLTGTPPFRGPPLEVAEAHLRRPLPALPATIPAEIGALVAALTDKNPANRPASAHEVAERAGQLRTTGKIALSGAILPVTASGGSSAASFFTLADIGAETTLASQPAIGARAVARHPRSTWKRAGTGLAVAAALTAAGLAGWQASLTGAARPHSTATPRPHSPPMVLVSSAGLVGQQAGFVVADLHRLGVRPRLARVPTSAQPPGTVLSVQPGGPLPPTTIVTVTVAAQPIYHGYQTGGGGRDGGSGNDGGGNGD
jgi:protein kinase-like protein